MHNPGLVPLLIILVLAFLAADFEPVVSDMGVGNLNEIQLFAVALFIWFAGRSRYLSAGRSMVASREAM